MPRRIIYGLLAAYWALMFTGTHWPGGVRVEQVAKHADKVVHFSGYWLLTILLVTAQRATRLQENAPSRLWLRRWGPMVAVVTIYAAFDELTQPYFRRDADILDWLADVAGMFVAAALCEWRAPPR